MWQRRRERTIAGSGLVEDEEREEEEREGDEDEVE